MSIIHTHANRDYLAIDEQPTILAAERHAGAYRAAAPFPHAVFDDFLPAEVAGRLAAEFPAPEAREESYNREQERLKSAYDPNRLQPGYAQAAFLALNSRPFLIFLEKLTGITGLLPDPYFLGGGFHETQRGGKLAVHADFNLHGRLNLQRRLNVLVYLNEEWDDAYGGHLEMWDRSMRAREKSVAPKFNRCVIFNTDDDSFHGHPDPLACPDGRSRRSLALYYYTASPTIRHELRTHNTDFRARPGSRDRHDLGVRADDLLRDLVPPLMYRGIHRLVGRLRAA